MQVLITGGTGLIGRHLIAALPDARITVLTRDTARAGEILPERVTLASSLSAIDDFDKFDAVVNLAGEPIADKRWTATQKQRICDSRWDITAQLVSRINDCSSPPDVFLSGSAIGYYGRQGDKVVTEAFTDVHDEFTHEVCAKWESLANGVTQEHTRVCTLRTGVVLSAEGGALPRMALPFKLGVGGKVGDGSQYLSWIHIDDMVNAIVFLLNDSHARGPFNMTAPQPQTNAAFSQTLASTLHRPNLFFVPAFVMKLIMGEAAEIILTGQQVLPDKLTKAGFTFAYPTLDKALQNIYQD
ncbi:TIGR01777 family oxidoreductase [Alteromonas sp. ASW11-19]|uniref:TIGR01777 family oxidoreductase n=1 Tax=Alteromonas salexigens TaxID=2982530 RepID=A0ABT2VTU2_9ALTE|nr:TIGR01777 family oxidoreductase [Alteromonas salexigens]MCU7555284.1 TIGR01777 family oxidoreductase [Alteromonas salexigens]